MKLNINDIIKLENGSYIVLDIINNRNNTYLFLINEDKYINDTSIVKANIKNNCIELNYIEDEEEFDYVLNKIYLDFKRDILSYFD